MNAVEQFADTIMKEACRLRASDLHIVPRHEDAVVQLRIGKDLVTKHCISKEFCERLVLHFKFLAAMDIGERRKPQNGSLQMKVNEEEVYLRLSTLPTIHHESLVIRMHLQTAVPNLSHLSLFPSSAKTLLSFLHHSHGLIIFTGPTGSGKTTTMYALLEVAKKEQTRRIVTLEDPVEKKKDGLLQIQINEKAGITYATGLKAILRHDPDIILVGEIRDEETAKVAVRASLTGHLVMTTLHTNDAKSAVLRLMDYGITLQEIEQSLLAVAAQRLVELKCPFCKGKCSPLCKKMRHVRRASIYELLYGYELKEVIREANGKQAMYQYTTLQDELRKGYALGFIEEDVYV
ncbi:competence protein ComG [Bacillus sp. AFS018417]|uniref:competence type IV pilus ATPase ComGA n=1 Tax=Bacillus sp. AFS018417 TaxID=2033491 RepID=UPI000BF3B175|nr:competence type IV pilus ATPase ComGA [Bacillus sp. AFS018417]PEZ07744.1 competence protein ComG [Bacillus sp. AFS018417]